MIRIINESDDMSVNPYLENYYEMMNILDSVALSGKSLTPEQKRELDRLAAENGDIQDEIEATADANDCGFCSTWDDIVVALRKLFASGERFPIK